MNIVSKRVLSNQSDKGSGAEKISESGNVECISRDDFYAFLPTNQYIFTPTRDLWPAASVNAKLKPINMPDGKQMKPSDWLCEQRAVEQMTWSPAETQVIHGRVVANGGWISKPGCTVFNQYRPPIVASGDPEGAGRWITHINSLYGKSAGHIVDWLAHRVQFPGQKINHALVLGGNMGIGKDSILEPVKYAVGPWNCETVSATQVMHRFNPFLKSVILLINEARDLGDIDRYAFYEHMKAYTAAPPDVFSVEDKNIRSHPVFNVCGVIITTNHKTNGLFIPSDDRRHYVAWSDRVKEDFSVDYWNSFYAWLDAGGRENVAAYLRTKGLLTFDAKAPPQKTPAFFEIVDANRAPEDAEIADTLDALGWPGAVTLTDLRSSACDSLLEWLGDPRARRQIPHRLESAGYVPFRNDAVQDGQWRFGGRRQSIYVKKTLSATERNAAARARQRPTQDE
jgi:hypothetical protein